MNINETELNTVSHSLHLVTSENLVQPARYM